MEMSNQPRAIAQKRKSRFDEALSEPVQKKIAFDSSAIAAKAAEISKQLSSKVVLTTIAFSLFILYPLLFLSSL